MHRADVQATTDQAEIPEVRALAAKFDAIKVQLAAAFTPPSEALKAALRTIEPRNRHEKRRAAALARRR